MKRVAIFIDGDNISPECASEIASKARVYGRIDLHHVYGNARNQGKWCSTLGARFIYAGDGKNGADLLLSLDAMDACVPGAFQTVVLVSSDADFTHLAHRLRARGCNVIGLGLAHASSAFQAACSAFEVLKAKSPSKPVKSPKSSLGELTPDILRKVDDQIRVFLDAKACKNETVQVNAVKQFVDQTCKTTISSLGFSTWKAYFKKHQDWYELLEAPANSKDRSLVVRRRIKSDAQSRADDSSAQAAPSIAAE